MAQIDHPYSNLTGGNWLLGNLHTHTTRSDGQRPPQAVIDEYAQRGHGFLMLSDHDCFADEAFLDSLDSRGMILLPGNEISAKGPHMLQVGGTEKAEPVEDRQAIIEAAIAADSFVICNHPNWGPRFNHFPQELLETLVNYIGIEVYNGVIGRLQGSPYASDRWQLLLDLGRRIWGFANDDSHKAEGDTGHGWNVAYVHEASREGVLEALRNGRFYGSTGVVINKVEVAGNRITIGTENAERITALGQMAIRFAVADGPEITVEVPETATQVRFECWGRGEQFAWTQPFWITP